MYDPLYSSNQITKKESKYEACVSKFDWHDQEFRREGWTEKRSAVHFCPGSGLFGSYNSD